MLLLIISPIVDFSKGLLVEAKYNDFSLDSVFKRKDFVCDLFDFEEPNLFKGFI